MGIKTLLISLLPSRWRKPKKKDFDYLNEILDTGQQGMDFEELDLENEFATVKNSNSANIMDTQKRKLYVFYHYLKNDGNTQDENFPDNFSEDEITDGIIVGKLARWMILMKKNGKEFSSNKLNVNVVHEDKIELVNGEDLEEKIAFTSKEFNYLCDYLKSYN
ncbi:hypothetical protein SNEBB_006667 [Seison nebaliae]|nr:hypothetical protein SNEBB_006667 [Seison nebaliae]